MALIEIKGRKLKNTWFKFDTVTGECERVERGIHDSINLYEYIERWKVNNPPPASTQDDQQKAA